MKKEKKRDQTIQFQISNSVLKLLSTKSYSQITIKMSQENGKNERNTNYTDTIKKRSE